MQPGFTCSRCGHQDVVEEYESPLPSHLLETNDPPLGSEEHFLREMVEKSDFEREIAEMDVKLATLEEMVSALRRRREKTAESFIATKGVLSPIRRMPAEVIGEIFMLALTEEDGSIKATSLNMAEGPWAYGRIHHLKNADQRLHSAEVLDAIIRRSQCRPLRLSVNIKSDSAIAKAILAKAVQHSYHWQFVQLSLTPHLFSRLKGVKSRVPLLVILRLVGFSANWYPISPKSIADCFRDAPALIRCKIIGFRDYHLMNLPWAQLTHLDESSDDPTAVLRRTPNLVSLALHGCIGPSTTQSRFRFEHLKTLDLSNCLLSTGLALDLPALIELRVSVGDLVHVTLATSSSLHQLSLRQSESESPEQLAALKTFVQQFPALSILDLSQMGLRPFLRLDLSDANAIPSLQRLYLGGDLLRNSLQPLVDMVQSRRLTSSTFREICFTPASGSDPEQVTPNMTPEIEALRQAGMEILLDQKVVPAAV
ncbi:hypothetical protein C8J56DRAFT_1160042 [Mycena floridula]|nr:hypothetical protein C8J56DRAFT_1160042 [Mycena floridula]